MLVKNKNIILTGATGGIGKAIISVFLENGANIFAIGSNNQRLEDLKAVYPSIQTLECNLSLLTKDSAENIVGKAREILGSIDCLISNAGITKDTLSLRMSEEEWNSVININLTSSFLLNQATTKIMRKDKTQGRIINMASIIGLTGNIGQVNYSASKGGLISMTKSFAREYAKSGITFNCIAPGFVDTDMTSKIPPEILEEKIKSVPMQRQANPKEIANVALFLASDLSSYITGETINVNGGLLMD